MKKIDVKFLTLMGIFTALEIIFCFTILGSVPIVPNLIVATLAHLPAICAAIMLGKKAGIWMGSVMAACCLIYWSVVASAHPTAFFFTPWAIDGRGNLWSLFNATIPRIIFPFIIAWLYEKFQTKNMRAHFAAGLAAAIGYAINSLLILSVIYFAFSGVQFSISGYINTIIAFAGVNFVAEEILGVLFAMVCVRRIKNAASLDKKA